MAESNSLAHEIASEIVREIQVRSTNSDRQTLLHPVFEVWFNEAKVAGRPVIGDHAFVFQVLVKAFATQGLFYCFRIHFELQVTSVVFIPIKNNHDQDLNNFYVQLQTKVATQPQVRCYFAIYTGSAGSNDCYGRDVLQ